MWRLICAEWWQGCESGSQGALPLCGQRSLDQIIWSDPVEWNGVREGQSVVLCFSLCSNVIRAHRERHGLDYNPPASLVPSFSELFAPSLFVSESSSLLSLSQTQSVTLPFNLTHAMLLGFIYSLLPPCAPPLICPLVLDSVWMEMHHTFSMGSTVFILFNHVF